MIEKNTRFNSAYSDHIDAIYDNISKKIIVAYRGYSRGNDYEHIVLGSIKGNNVTFNKLTLLHDHNLFYPTMAYDSLNNKVIIAFTDNYSRCGIIRLGTVKEDNITFSKPIIFSRSDVCNVKAIYHPIGKKIIIVYEVGGDNWNSFIKVGTVSEDNIIFNNPANFSNNAIHSVSVLYDSGNDKIVLAYSDYDNNHKGIIKVGTLVDDTIVFGGEVVFNNSDTRHTSMVYDPKSKKIIIAYANNPVDSDSLYTDCKSMVRVGTINDNSITLSEPVIFSNNLTESISTLYHPVNDQILIAYRNYEDDYITEYGTHDYAIMNGYIVAGTVTEDSISINKSVVFSANNPRGISLVYDSDNNKAVVIYHDGYEGYGTAKVI